MTNVLDYVDKIPLVKGLEGILFVPILKVVKTE